MFKNFSFISFWNIFGKKKLLTHNINKSNQLNIQNVSFISQSLMHVLYKKFKSKIQYIAFKFCTSVKICHTKLPPAVFGLEIKDVTS